MSDTTEKAKTPAGADPLDFKDEANIRRFVRPNRWVSLDIAGIPVRAEILDFFVDRGAFVVRIAWRRCEASPRGRESFPARIPIPNGQATRGVGRWPHCLLIWREHKRRARETL